MKLLLDQNLSPRLIERLVDVFPGSAHVQTLGLERASDEEIWSQAAKRGLTIVTKDEDFNHMSVMRGNPPKVIWLQTKNCGTDQVEAAFRSHLREIEAFEKDSDAGTIVLRLPP